MSVTTQNIMIETIAETGFTHKGDINYIKKMIELAVEAKMSFIKFQIILDVESVYTKNSKIFEDLSSFKFSEDDWSEILSIASSAGLKILAMPIDYKAVDLISQNINIVDLIEVHSIALNDVILLEKLSNLSIRFSLGVGGRTSSEIDFAIKYLGDNTDLLIAGFQSFPTNKSRANIGKLRTLDRYYPQKVGYADHTPFDVDDSDIILAALGLGASFIEKHIILDAGDSNRPDYYSAIDKIGALKLQKNISNFINYFGNDDINMLSVEEAKYLSRERKIVAAVKMLPNTKIQRPHLCYKDIGGSLSGIPQTMFENLIGMEITKVIEKNDPIKLEDLK